MKYMDVIFETLINESKYKDALIYLKDIPTCKLNEVNVYWQNYLHIVCEKSYFEYKIIILQYLLEYIDPNSYDMAWETPLMYSCKILDYKCVNLLLKYLANPNSKNGSGKTCIYLALNNPEGDKQYKVFELLMDNGGIKPSFHLDSTYFNEKYLNEKFDKLYERYTRWKRRKNIVCSLHYMKEDHYVLSIYELKKHIITYI
jgi:hypothetical protein